MPDCVVCGEAFDHGCNSGFCSLACETWTEAHEGFACGCGHEGYLHDEGVGACVSCSTCRDFEPAAYLVGVGAHVVTAEGRLFDVKGVYQDERGVMLRVRHFNGEEAPDVALGSVRVLERTYEGEE